MHVSGTANPHHCSKWVLFQVAKHQNGLHIPEFGTQSSMNGDNNEASKTMNNRIGRGFRSVVFCLCSIESTVMFVRNFRKHPLSKKRSCAKRALSTPHHTVYPLGNPELDEHHHINRSKQGRSCTKYVLTVLLKQT